MQGMSRSDAGWTFELLPNRSLEMEALSESTFLSVLDVGSPPEYRKPELSAKSAPAYDSRPRSTYVPCLPVMFGSTPNTTGWFTLGRNSGCLSKVDGTLFYFSQDDPTAAATERALDAQRAVFDPSRVDPMYGRASTVQVASLRLLPCIKF